MLGPPKSITTVLPLGCHARVQRFFRQIEIEKAGAGDLHLAENTFRAQPRGDLFSDGAGIGFCCFGRRQGAIALERRKIGTIRHLHLAKAFRQTFRGERLTGDARKFSRERGHGA